MPGAQGRLSRGDELRLQVTAPTPLPAVRIQPLPHDHPCADAGQPAFGLFARRALEAGELVGNYTGLAEERDSARPYGSEYIMSLPVPQKGGGTLHVDVDAEKVGNESRFINDYRSVAKRPNVQFHYYRSEHAGEAAVGVVVLAPIAAGDELLIDYGEEYWPQHEEQARHGPFVRQLYVNTLGAPQLTISFEHSYTVGKLRQLISEKSGMPLHEVRLIFKGKWIEDHRTLAQCEVHKEAIIFNMPLPKESLPEQGGAGGPSGAGGGDDGDDDGESDDGGESDGSEGDGEGRGHVDV